MKAFFKELFEYNSYFNQKIFELLNDHQDQLSERLRELCSHTVNAHSIWINKIIIQRDVSPKPWNKLDVRELIKIDKTNFESSISVIDNFDLSSKVSYAISNGNTFINSVSDILFQIINHSTYHRGQIATELRKCEINPLLTDWIFYKMEQKHNGY